MKKQMMILSLILSSLPAHASLGDVKGSLTLHCEGEDGSAYFEHSEQGMHYEVKLKSQSWQGDVASLLIDGSQYEQSGATVIEPVYQKSKWLSVSVLKGTHKWTPPHQGCLPTRTLECHLGTMPGYYSNAPDKEWIDLMVDLTKPGEVSFMSLDIQGYGYLKSLGAHTSCELKASLE